MTGEIRPSNTETISPAGLSWENIGMNYWVLHSHGYFACTVFYSPAGYRLNHNLFFDTLAEAQAVAIALIAMRSK